MQTWKYYERMERQNPVCEDAGAILRIIPNFPPVQYTYSHILEIETEDGRFACDTKYPFVKYGGYCAFCPLGENPKEPDEFVQLRGIKDGETVDVRPGRAYLIGSDFLNPITTDPRILCIMHRAHHKLGAHPTEKQILEFCKHIPDRKEAVAYLKTIHAQMTCLPEDDMYKKIESEERR